MRCEILDKTVENISVFVYHKDVPHSPIRKLITYIALDLVEILVARNAVNAQRHPGHDGLLLFNQHVRVLSDGTQVDVVLDTESQAQKHDQQEHQSRPKAVEELPEMVVQQFV